MLLLIDNMAHLARLGVRQQHEVRADACGQRQDTGAVSAGATDIQHSPLEITFNPIIIWASPDDRTVRLAPEAQVCHIVANAVIQGKERHQAGRVPGNLCVFDETRADVRGGALGHPVSEATASGKSAQSMRGARCVPHLIDAALVQEQRGVVGVPVALMRLSKWQRRDCLRQGRLRSHTKAVVVHVANRQQPAALGRAAVRKRSVDVERHAVLGGEGAGHMAPLPRGDVGGRERARVTGNEHTTISNLKYNVDVCVAINTRVFAGDDEAVARRCSGAVVPAETLVPYANRARLQRGAD